MIHGPKLIPGSAKPACPVPDYSPECEKRLKQLTDHLVEAFEVDITFAPVNGDL